jgi:uncharacterized phage protein (TIGR01671 family)
MREIRFRAWRDWDKTMRYDVTRITFSEVDAPDGQFRKGDPIQISFVPDNTTSEGLGLGRIKLMQFTGLKDKNGKEIYEGDVVMFEYKPPHWPGLGKTSSVEEIKWDINGFNDALRHKAPKHCEVIGNIYENPELLK